MAKHCSVSLTIYQDPHTALDQTPELQNPRPPLCTFTNHWIVWSLSLTASNTAAVAVMDQSANSSLAFEMNLRTRSRY